MISYRKFYSINLRNIGHPRTDLVTRIVAGVECLFDYRINFTKTIINTGSYSEGLLRSSINFGGNSKQ